MLRIAPLRSFVESNTIWFTPAFSVNTCACSACVSSQMPFAGLPVKSMSFTSGRNGNCCASASPCSCATSVPTPGLECHHERLAGRVHDRVRHERALLVDAIEDLETDADPPLGARLAPRFLRPRDSGEELIDVELRVRDAQRETVWRALAAD